MRRRVRLVTLVPLVFLLGLVASPAMLPAVAATNAVVTENQQPGTTAWQLPGLLTADDTTKQIKGYASTTSVLQGGSITFYVTVNPVQTYTIDVYRIGWYGGAGGRLRLHVGPLAGIQQAACPTDATTGMIACTWPPAYSTTIASDWTSGVYLALLTNAAGYQNYIPFVVRDSRPAALLYQQSVTTYQAYNNYPDDRATGKSLYGYNSSGAVTVGTTPAAVKVSFDRPYADDGAGQFLNWEINLVRWLERSGYDVTYSTNLDTHSNGAALLTHRGFLSTGHDEYWSNEMYNAAQAARDAGVSLAFLGSDSIFWQVRFESSASGVANRVMVGYKSASTDPIQGPTTTVEWRDPPVNRPEQTIKGVQYTNSVNWGSLAGYVVTNSTSWVYAGTGFKDGDTVPGIVGYEMDRYMPDVAGPTTTNLTLLSHSPFTSNGGVADYSNSSIYQVASGAWVFSTGTMSWSWALDDFGNGSGLVDPRIQQTTANVLNAFIATAPLAVHDLKVVVPASATAGQAFSASVTAEDANGTPVTSYSGTVHFASSDTSSGVILPADSTLTNGQGTFSVTLIKAGAQTLTASDVANSLSTTVSATVTAQAASRLAIVSSATPTAGTSFPFSVTAQDPYGNTDTSYAGTVHFTSTDTSAGVSLPPDSTLANGQRTFSATLIKVGTQIITGTAVGNTSVTGSLTVRVAPGVAATIAVSTPATVKANQPFVLTVTLRDRYGNLATTYTGTLHFTSSDMLAMPANQLPADYAFTAAEGGSHSFAASLVTPGTQTITATDTSNAGLMGTSPPITVTLF
jgi:N,N-dimethylformamidase beta subunit-like protein